LDVGEEAYVDADGMLKGVKEASIKAAGRKIRDVVRDLTVYVSFERYQFIRSGKRTIEVRGAVKHPAVYEYPKDEEWNLMNLLLQVNGAFQLAESNDFLLIRKSWDFPNTFVFIRGQGIGSEEGIGGDDLLLYAGDLIIFPGKEHPVYVFGAVKDQAECFTFPNSPMSKPTLEIAIQQAGGIADKADFHNIYVYRLLNSRRQSIFTLDLEREKGFALQPWDIIYVPPQIPRSFISNP
jgi:protein involved in polysaccharide export with SLBB domain